jgi:hypothetical protein
MLLRQMVDSMFLQSTISTTLATGGHSVQLLFAFEYIILASTIIATFLKYTFSMVDSYMEVGTTLQRPARAPALHTYVHQQGTCDSKVARSMQPRPAAALHTSLTNHMHGSAA